MKNRVIAIASLFALLAMCVFIFSMSAKPAIESDELSLGVVEQIINALVPGYDQMNVTDQLHWQNTFNHYVRKCAHFLEYAALGALALNALIQCERAFLAFQARERKLWTLALAAWLFCIAYAAIDEVHQIFVPGRSGMASDVAIDSLGALLGIALTTIIFMAHAKKTRAC